MNEGVDKADKAFKADTPETDVLPILCEMALPSLFTSSAADRRTEDALELKKFESHVKI